MVFSIFLPVGKFVSYILCEKVLYYSYDVLFGVGQEGFPCDAVRVLFSDGV